MRSEGVREIPVTTQGGAYSVFVGFGLSKELKAVLEKEARKRRIAIITDDRVGSAIAPGFLATLQTISFEAELFTFPHGEKNKTQETATRVQHELLKKGFGRDTLVIALGGGVAGDLGGYVAATYMRGVPYVHVPTTLLAMVDSSIGGKVGVDTPYGKNTVGAFAQPKAVIADLDFLRSLPEREFQSGLLEAVKSFITSDVEALTLAEELDLNNPLGRPDLLLDLVARSIAFKAEVVSRDEREGNERQILNFGHTVGHAFELLSEYSLPHGFAVGYGMLVEMKIAELLGILSATERAAIVDILSRLGILQRDVPQFSTEKILEAMKADKKTRAGVPQFVLLQSRGAVDTSDGEYAHAVEERTVREALQSLAAR
ncbi:MAG: 3-dehydroquinate synthase [Candidatus Kaiserbacteria bacterium]|nr:MAG: 3-dehydroquinate synthase [Candidatus Kaiserbacteria bacterium]